MTPDFIDPAIGWPVAAVLFALWLVPALIRARKER